MKTGVPTLPARPARPATGSTSRLPPEAVIVRATGAETLMVPPASAVAPEALIPDNISLLCWNIQKQRSPAIHDALRHYAGSTQLALLQEVWLEERLGSCFSHPWQAEFHQGWRSARRTTGVMTLAHAPASRSQGRTSQEPLLRTAKATSLCHYPLIDREDDLLVVNIHAINFSLGTRGYRRQLQHVATEIRQHRGPVIFAGDLNAWSRERQAILDEFCAFLGLTEVPYDEDARTRVMKRPLDYIFVRDAEILAARAAQHPCSDHNPLEVTLSC